LFWKKKEINRSTFRKNCVTEKFSNKNQFQTKRFFWEYFDLKIYLPWGWWERSSSKEKGKNESFQEVNFVLLFNSSFDGWVTENQKVFFLLFFFEFLFFFCLWKGSRLFFLAQKKILESCFWKVIKPRRWFRKFFWETFPFFLKNWKVFFSSSPNFTKKSFCWKKNSKQSSKSSKKILFGLDTYSNLQRTTFSPSLAKGFFLFVWICRKSWFFNKNECESENSTFSSIE